MAEEAFALSPISASAASPTDADYHAIREAFMETARGRWFLTEYAKRNRNADTAMVLEAVARIEQSIGAAAQAEAAAPPASEAALAALDRARAAIRHQFSETGFDRALLPWRKSARIIREIVWGLRESGADPRICNILDGQVRAIEAACDEFPLEEIRDRMLLALDAAVSQGQEAVPVAAEDASNTSVAEVTAEAVSAPAQPIEPQAAAAEAPVMEAFVAEASVAEVVAEPAIAEVAIEVTAPTPFESAASELDPAKEIKPETLALAEQAAEHAPVVAVAEIPEHAPVTAAPRSIMTASAAQPVPQPMAEPAPAETPIVATTASLPQAPSPAEPAPEGATPAAATQDSDSGNDLWADIEAEIAPLPPFDPAHEVSLGASLIAQGVVARPSNGRVDLLAPIRRMSHAERIAFFS